MPILSASKPGGVKNNSVVIAPTKTCSARRSHIEATVGLKGWAHRVVVSLLSASVAI
jgi:hypothetical protein